MMFFTFSEKMFNNSVNCVKIYSNTERFGNDFGKNLLLDH